MTIHNRVTRSPRHGFTLMEVLISIGVVAIGLLGVVQLLPLAYHQAFVGTQEDRKAVAGRAGFAGLRVRELINPANWITTTGTPVVNVATLASDLTDLEKRPTAFCLDPLFSAYNPSNNAFPYDSPLMPRITAKLGVNSGTPSTALAELAAAYQDDLEFEFPTDPLALPYQVDAVPNSARWNGSNAGTRRQTGGRFSWIATFVPDLDGDRDMYVVSLVVMYNRLRTRMITRQDASTFDPRDERAVNIVFNSGGFSGGDCTLTTRGAIKDDLERLRSGDWIMVSGQFAADSKTFPLHKWYRVVHTEGDVQGNGPFTRDVTLLGPDWSPGWGAPAQATIVEGAVGVYSKTMRLDTSSLWRAQ